MSNNPFKIKSVKHINTCDIYPYITDNQPNTPPYNTPGNPHCFHVPASGSSPKKPVRRVAAAPTAAKAPGKPHFASFFSFRKATAPIWVLLVLLFICKPTWGIDWNINGNGSTTINCNTITLNASGKIDQYTTHTYTITSTGPDCPITVTLTANSMGGSGGNVYLDILEGSTQLNASHWTKSTSTSTSVTSTGGSITISFTNTNGKASSNRSFSLSISQTCPCGGGGSDCDVDCDAGNYFENLESYAGSDNYNEAGILPDGWNYSSTGTSSNLVPHIVNQNCEEVQPCSGSKAIVLASGSATTCGNENIAILPMMNVTTGTMSFCYVMDATILDGNNSVLEVGYVDLCGDFHTLNTPTNATVCTSYSFNITSQIPSGTRLAFRWSCSNGNYNMYIMSIDNICVPVADCNKRTGNFYYATTSASILAGNTYTNTTLANGTGASPAYSICPTGAGATINASTGLVTTTADADGQFTVFAVIPASNGYCDTAVSYTLTVANGCPVVGDESNSNYNEGLGLATYYQYTWAEMIYTAAELGATDGCTITSIAFKVNGASSEMDEPQTTTIYLGLTAKNQFDGNDDFVSPAGGAMTASYTGTWTLHDGWNVFTLSTPFVYTDATKNLIVGMLCTNDNSYAIDYIYYTTSANRFICGYSDYDIPDPENMAAFDDDYYDNKNRHSNRPDIKICMNCCNIEATIEISDP